MAFQARSVLKVTTAFKLKGLRVLSIPQRRTHSLQAKDHSKTEQESRSRARQDSKVYTNAHSTSLTA